MALGRDSEEKRGHKGRHPPWGVSNLCHLLGSQAWGLTKGRPAPWVEGCWGGGLWEAWTEPAKRVHALACPQGRVERAVWDWTSGCPVFCNRPSTCPSPSLSNVPTLLISWLSSALDRGLPWLRKERGLGTQRRLRPGAASRQGGGSLCWHLHRRHSRGSLDLGLHQPSVTHAPQCSESPHGPLLPQHCPPGGPGSQSCGRGDHWLTGGSHLGPRLQGFCSSTFAPDPIQTRRVK